jgi:putative methionine-R-sulfoxide reductase with GAF domain
MSHAEERERFSRAISTLALSGAARQKKAREIAERIRQWGEFRWVGIYDVGPDEIAVIGWSGPAAPTHPRFPISQGLNGAAVKSGDTIVVGDVSKDARYLTTLGTTRAEMVVPVKVGGRTIGTIDIESEIVNRFGAADRELVEECARAIVGLWADER